MALEVYIGPFDTQQLSTAQSHGEEDEKGRVEARFMLLGQFQQTLDFLSAPRLRFFDFAGMTPINTAHQLADSGSRIAFEATVPLGEVVDSTQDGQCVVDCLWRKARIHLRLREFEQIRLNPIEPGEETSCSLRIISQMCGFLSHKTTEKCDRVRIGF